MLLVDTNPGEHGVHAALEASLGASVVGRQRLEIGDVLLTVPGGRIIVERKTFGDLTSSLHDRRYSEQKLRLLAERERSEDRVDLVYIIESRSVPSWVHKTGGIANSQPFAAITKMTLRDRITVLFTASPEDTAAQVAYIYTAALKGGFDGQAKAQAVAASGYAGVCKFDKKRKNAEANPLQMMLCTIPGCSGAKAEAVAEKFPSVGALVRAYEGLPTARADALLADLVVGSKRLGPALSAKIRLALV
jgi:ERCC4-type nuclease